MLTTRGVAPALALVALVACRPAPPPAEPSPDPSPAAAPAPAPAEAASDPAPPAAPRVPEPAGTPPERPAPPTLDMHVHLTDADAVPPLIEAMDRLGVQRSVVLGTQNALGGRARGVGMEGHTEGNAIALAAAKAHPTRLVAFAAVDLESDTPDTFTDWKTRGGCGFKIAQGDRRLRVRPLDDPRYTPLWARLAELGAPVLIHVNTTRFRPEFERVLDAHPTLNAVCAHWCSSRTDLDRFEAIAAAHPTLRFDVSSGGPGPSAAGTANLSAHRERAAALVARWPDRFLFGSDLVTHRFGEWRTEWDAQIEMDRRFVTDAAVRTWVPAEMGGATIERIPALDLEPALARRLLADNARDWLKGCLR